MRHHRYLRGLIFENSKNPNESALNVRNHRYLRGMIFEIIKNPNEINTFVLQIAKTQAKSTQSCV
jgi:hypothetical protein